MFTMKCSDKIGTSDIYVADIGSNYSEKINHINTDLNKNLPFPDNQFDVILSNQLIEHLTDIDNFLDEIYRILKPSGYAIISTPNLSCWDDIFALLLGYRPFSIDYSRVKLIGNPLSPISFQEKSSLVVNGVFIGHNKVFTYQALKELFEIHGFKVKRIVGAGYHPFYVKKLMNLFSKIDPRHSRFLVMKVIK